MTQAAMPFQWEPVVVATLDATACVRGDAAQAVVMGLVAAQETAATAIRCAVNTTTATHSDLVSRCAGHKTDGCPLNT